MTYAALFAVVRQPVTSIAKPIEIVVLNYAIILYEH